MSKLILFKNADLGGDALQLTASDSDLRPQKFKNNVSSLIVIDGDWEVFERDDFAGEPLPVTADGGPAGDGVYPDASDWNGKDNRIASAKLVE